VIEVDGMVVSETVIFTLLTPLLSLDFLDDDH
jgi:hypothetical protein